MYFDMLAVNVVLITIVSLILIVLLSTGLIFVFNPLNNLIWETVKQCL